MPLITLPDASQRQFDHPITLYDIAHAIGPGLAKAAVAGKVNGVLVDTSHIIDQDADIQIITDKTEEGLSVLRHSAAHLLAQAVKQLFPSAQVTIGPVIEDGFYYDFAFERPFTPEDLVAIEKEMIRLSKADIVVERSVMARDEAVQFFLDKGEHYKAEIISDIPQDQTISLYRQGDFIDLCRGPHVPSTGKLKVFKLTKVSGAFWRGDAKNAMLQRVYGTAWADKKSLKQYTRRLEEAQKRDHRRIGKQLNLFHMQEEAPGMVFWHDNGWKIYQIIEQYIRQTLNEHGYQEVKTPLMADRSLWEKSGHWDKFGKEMFTTQSEKHEFAIKPMNCPCHIQIFNQGLKSHRDLPLRMAEFGSCHRNEPSGTLHGLMRVRGFVQDDAHIFCTEEQIQAEVTDFMTLLFGVYKDFGFEDVLVKLSTRPVNRVGSDTVWDKAEKALQEALDHQHIEWELQPGEGAFYGPKIEFSLRDCLGRVWQCGTIQVDFSMPEKLGATYVSDNNAKKTPVMLHRAILGSLERFIGILLEQYAGALPTWLSPTQVVVISIADRHAVYAKEIELNLKNIGFRVNSDSRSEKIGFKIREHTLQKVPYLLVVGDQEIEGQSVSVRQRGGQDLGSMTVDAFAQLLGQEKP